MSDIDINKEMSILVDEMVVEKHAHHDQIMHFRAGVHALHVHNAHRDHF